MGQIAAALQVSCQRGVNQCPRAAAEEIQTLSLSLNADPSCWQAAADQRMAATNQLTVSRQPANNPSHNIQRGSAAEDGKCGVPSLSFIDGIPPKQIFCLGYGSIFYSS